MPDIRPGVAKYYRLQEGDYAEWTGKIWRNVCDGQFESSSDINTWWCVVSGKGYEFNFDKSTRPGYVPFSERAKINIDRVSGRFTFTNTTSGQDLPTETYTAEGACEPAADPSRPSGPVKF